MTWDGNERRTGMVSRDEFNAFVEESGKSRQELRDIVRDIRGTVVDVQRDLKCIHETWEVYADTITQTKLNNESRAKLKAAIIEKSIAGAVWAMVVFIAMASWDYLKAHIK